MSGEDRNKTVRLELIDVVVGTTLFLQQYYHVLLYWWGFQDLFKVIFTVSPLYLPPLTVGERFC